MLQEDTFIIDVAMVQFLSVIFIFVVHPDLQHLFTDFPRNNPDSLLFVKDVRLDRTADLIVTAYVVGVAYYLLKKFLFPPRLVESIPKSKSKSKSKTKLVSLKSLAVPLV